MRYKFISLLKIYIMASLNKQALLRYRIIDELITNNDYPTMQDIINLCEDRLGKIFSSETIQKDIEAMKNDLSLGYEAPIKFNRSYRGYEYTDKSFSINTTNLNSLEKEQLKAASEIIYQFKEAKFGESIKDISQKLKIIANSPELLYQGKIIEFENSNFKHYDLLQQLYQAIKNKNKINFVYYCYEQNDISSYTVFPLLLKEYSNNWFLIIENKFNEPQEVNLNYMFDVFEITTDDTPKKELDVNKYLKHSVGVKVNSDFLEEVEILYKAKIANEIKNNPLHSSQNIIQEFENGDLLISYKLYVTSELVSEILKYGNSAFVTKNELVQDLIFEAISDNWVEYRRTINNRVR